MDARLKAEVRRRAGFCCEYCQFPERFAELRFQVDHIVPQIREALMQEDSYFAEPD